MEENAINLLQKVTYPYGRYRHLSDQIDESQKKRDGCNQNQKTYHVKLYISVRIYDFGPNRVP